jgi:hypothetical protein
MGASLTMIDRHYGHLARDGREHAIQQLDAPNTSSTGGRLEPSTPPYHRPRPEILPSAPASRLVKPSTREARSVETYVVDSYPRPP